MYNFTDECVAQRIPKLPVKANRARYVSTAERAARPISKSNVLLFFVILESSGDKTEISTTELQRLLPGFLPLLFV